MKNTAMNEHTGRQLTSGHATDTYRQGHTSIFGDKERARYEKYVKWAGLNNVEPILGFDEFQEERDHEPRWAKHPWDLL
jgi:hypothetical protein